VRESRLLSIVHSARMAPDRPDGGAHLTPVSSAAGAAMNVRVSSSRPLRWRSPRARSTTLRIAAASRMRIAGQMLIPRRRSAVLLRGGCGRARQCEPPTRRAPRARRPGEGRQYARAPPRPARVQRAAAACGRSTSPVRTGRSRPAVGASSAKSRGRCCGPVGWTRALVLSASGRARTGLAGGHGQLIGTAAADFEHQRKQRFGLPVRSSQAPRVGLTPHPHGCHGALVFDGQQSRKVGDVW